MTKILSVPKQIWDFSEGATLYIFSAIAATALAHHGTSNLLNLLFTNLPMLTILAISLIREKIENRRWSYGR